MQWDKSQYDDNGLVTDQIHLFQIFGQNNNVSKFTFALLYSHEYSRK